VTQKKTQKKTRLRVGRLQSAWDVELYQARIIKQASRGGGEVVNECYKLCMMASMLVKTLEVSSLEERIADLERRRS